MRRRRNARVVTVGALVMLFHALGPSPVAAQPPSGASSPSRPFPRSEQAAAERLDAPSGPRRELTLHAAPALGALAAHVGRVLRRRTGASVRVAEPPPLGLAEAVPAGDVALERVPDGVRIVRAQGAGAHRVTTVRLDGPLGPAAARAVALAIESLGDTLPASRDGGSPSSRDPSSSARGDDPNRPRAAAQPDETGASSSRPANAGFRGALPDLPHWTPEPRALAKPTIYFRLLLGVSPLRRTLLLGPGAGFGLCGVEGTFCVVLDGDLSLIPLERVGQSGVIARYRFFNGALRAQYRPFSWGDWALGATLGLLTRVGRARVVDTDESATVTGFGGRGTLELSYRFAPPFEMLFEAGADLAVSRARFIRYRDSIFLEDRWTPWLMVGIRMRP